ncbi:hypothetical protein ABPG77_009435 [Micractinium sp. CCAP 211/92]
MEACASGLPPPLGVAVAPTTPAGVQAGGGARLWLPADQMYALRMAAGAEVLVGVARAGPASDEPAPLAELFRTRLQVQSPSPALLPLQPGSALVAADLWPAQGLGRGMAALSPVLRDALARPDPGACLLVYQGGGADRSAVTPAQEHQQQAQQCAHVYVRMCQQLGQGPAPAGEAGPAAPAAALLPQDDPPGPDAGAAGAQQSPVPGKGHQGSTPVGRGPVQSPAMRGGSAPPVALSPAMRSRGGPPVALSPGATRGRPGRATPQGGKAAGAPPVTPPAGSSSSRSSSMAGGSKQQERGLTSDKAKAQALLASLLGEDPSPRVRGLVEALLLRQLAGRRLLPGNLVGLPMFGQQALFVVEGMACAAGRAQDGAAVTQAAAADGPSAAILPPPVGASTAVHLLLGSEAAPDPAPAGQPTPQQLEDWPAQAAAAAAEALGCSLEDAGPMAARRAAAAGQASRAITFDDLGGAVVQGEALRELVALPLQAPHLFWQYSITPPRGVLLYGPPGTGKTVLACATASLARARFFVINGPEVVSEYFGESEAGLRGIFAAASALAPSVIFIDELDAVAPARGGRPGSGKSSATSTASARVVTTLLTEMDSLGASPVVVIAATNRPDSLDPALRRPGRFDREVEVGVPSPPERRDILAKQLRNMAHELTPQQVDELADAAHGYVAADLAALCSEAAVTALRRVVASNIRGCGSEALCRVTLADFQAAETRTRPSAMRELAFEIPRVSWEDIGGLEEVKQRIREAVELPFKEPEALRRLGVVPPRGILLHGPPGCSKTLLARAVASQARLNFISVKGPELFSKYVGESEKALAALFAKARRSSPAVIFFDEIDGLVSTRDNAGDSGVGVSERMLSQLLQEMDGLQTRPGVIVIAATNRLDCLDPALLRPGRFDRLLPVPPPDNFGRAAIFGVHTRAMPLAPDVSLELLAQQTTGFTGAAIAACCQDAALAALEEDINARFVKMSHFVKAVDGQLKRLVLSGCTY